MFQIYHLRHIPAPTRRSMLQLWQQLAVAHGLPGLHLVECLTQHVPVQGNRGRGRAALAQAGGSKAVTPLSSGHAASSLASSGSSSSSSNPAGTMGSRGSNGDSEKTADALPLLQAVMEYAPNYGKWSFQPAPPEKLHPVHYRGEHVAWDNSPRHAAEQGFLARVDVHDDPVHLEARLTARMRLARADLRERQVGEADSSLEAFFFVTAWNEWGEGNALEPNNVYGFGNLNALARAYVRSRAPRMHCSEVLKRLRVAMESCNLVIDTRDTELLHQGAKNDTEGRKNSTALVERIGMLAMLKNGTFSLIPGSKFKEDIQQCSLLARRLDYNVVEHLVSERLL